MTSTKEHACSLRELLGRTVVIVGAGKSGLSAARLCVARGAHVVLNDSRSEGELGTLAEEARVLGVRLELGAHPEGLFSRADLIVLSPGVPSLAAVRQAEACGVRVVPEVELAASFLEGTLLGVTGSNGKSTVTTLLGEMAARAGRPSFTGGNLGDALSLAVGTDAASKDGLIVAELSSFQLERVTELRCHIALCLNVTDDHLDRHGSFAAYAAAKGRIFLSQTPEDHAIVRAGDALTLAMARAGRARVHTFGLAEGDVCVREGKIVDRTNGLSYPIADLRIRGRHNVENACAAALAARLAGISAEVIAEVLTSFPGLPHRMASVRVLDGVEYFDDSKATNVGATIAALEGLDERSGKVVLIAGGVDKGGSYAALADKLASRGRGVVLIGSATPLLRDAFAALDLPKLEASSIDEAVRQARTLARPGDAVLLAPACASFDMFRSYAHRGDEFARVVLELPEAQPWG